MIVYFLPDKGLYRVACECGFSHSLTDSQWQVAGFVLDGMTNKGMGALLNLSRKRMDYKFRGLYEAITCLPSCRRVGVALWMLKARECEIQVI